MDRAKVFITGFLITLVICTNAQRTKENKLIDNLTLINTNITNHKKVKEKICGNVVLVTSVKVKTTTKVQTFCSFGDPYKNKFSKVTNEVKISYVYDSSGVLLDSMLSEIQIYFNEQKIWADQYNPNYDFTHLPFIKSFLEYKNGYIPFISTLGEKPGDYRIYYLNGYVYKVELLKCNGMGCLSSFSEQNMYFTEKGAKISWTEYIKHLTYAQEVLQKLKTH